MLTLEKFSFGVGDRFAHQARAQLRAFQRLARDSVDAVPVWNKSNREHSFIGSEPQSAYDAARDAVKALGWEKGWHVDADHIRIETVGRYLDSSDFFTIDVADSIGKMAEQDQIHAFVDGHGELVGKVHLPGIERPFETSRTDVHRIAGQYLLAAKDAGRIFRHIASRKGGGQFIAEVSMDETDAPQTPPELLVILTALADEGVKAQTIAPKFTGRFNKGVDYVGDLAQFEREFHDDLAVIAHAGEPLRSAKQLEAQHPLRQRQILALPNRAPDASAVPCGVHLKTAGTTWLEELIGLAEAGGDGLAFAKEIYATALDHVDELCAPYAAVIDIDRAKLPASVSAWTSEQFVRALRHVPADPQFNPSLRQLLHVSFKLAAKTGRRYLDLLEANAEVVGRNVTENLYDRHMRPLFLS
jgi:hypothetical protein